MSSLATGCGSVWLERSVRDAEAARSNRAIPTIKKQTGSSVKLEPVFFTLQAACVPCRVSSVSVMVGRMVRLSAQRRLAYPDPVQSACASPKAVRMPASPRAFPRADGSPAFAGTSGCLVFSVRLHPGCGRTCGKRACAVMVSSKAGRAMMAAA